MDRAEQRALEAYPVLFSERRGYDNTFKDRRESYIKGYRQAEKDLDVSWVKEVSGVKDMSRAEEEALKAYPPRSIAANYDTINRRDAFEYGYLKAEKDLELGWEDIKLIIDIVDSENLKPHLFDEIDYQEVLKRFKDYKERKQQ